MARLGSQAARPGLIPAFALYGEAERDAELRFLHVESLASRNRVHGWDIRPHRHHDLTQFFLVEQGSGEAMLDEVVRTIRAPALIAIPPPVVHGFRYHPTSVGTVITASDGYLRDLVGLVGDAAVADVLSGPLLVEPTVAEVARVGVAPAFHRIADEFVFAHAGRTAVIAANLLVILAGLARLKRAARPTGGHPETAAHYETLFARFREGVERHFREHRPVSAYADALATTERSLHRACQRIAGQSPLKVIHQRLVLEAKRHLIYTGMSVAEVGYSLGFDDPAYFTRFFSENVGEAPAAFRRARVAPGSDPASEA